MLVYMMIHQKCPKSIDHHKGREDIAACIYKVGQARTLKFLWPLQSILHVPLSTTTMTIADMCLGLRDSNDDCIIHTLDPHGTRKDHTIMASTPSNASHLRSIQAYAITFLQQAYPWIKRSDIFEQKDHRTPLTREHQELVLTRQHMQGNLLRNSSMIGMIFLHYLMMR